MIMFRIRIGAARFALKASRWFAEFIAPEITRKGDRS